MTENTENKDESKPKNRSYYSTVYPGIWLIVIGGIFLLNNFGYFKGDAWGKLWPLFIIVPGIFMVLQARRR